MKFIRVYQCAAIIQSGEFLIDHWDGKQCIEKNPYMLIKCEHCGLLFCLMSHWHKHLDSISPKGEKE